MNKSPPISHLQLNVSSAESLNFYKELLTYLGYSEVYADDLGFGVEREGFSLWIYLTEEKHRDKKFHRKCTGINHLAFKADSKEFVDKFCEEFLKANDVATLYGSPKPFEEYSPEYYAVYFEDPDRIKLEVAYHE